MKSTSSSIPTWRRTRSPRFMIPCSFPWSLPRGWITVATRWTTSSAPPPAPAPAWRVYCLPARADRDELAGRMLAHVLREQGFHPENALAKLVAGDLVKTVEQADVDAVCISVVAPSTVIHARYLCTKLRAQSRDLKIAVGLWGATENIAGAAQRLRESGADEVVTTLADAVVQLAKLAPPAQTSK